jgi:hypothetical protein
VAQRSAEGLGAVSCLWGVRIGRRSAVLVISPLRWTTTSLLSWCSLAAGDDAQWLPRFIRGTVMEVEVRQVGGATTRPARAVGRKVAIGGESDEQLVERGVGTEALCETRQAVAAAASAVAAGDADNDVWVARKRVMGHGATIGTNREYLQDCEGAPMLAAVGFVKKESRPRGAAPWHDAHMRVIPSC